MNRVSFLVDGFNVYHSLKDAQGVLRRPLKWLDLRGLCGSYVRSSVFGRAATLGQVTYFSAYATFLTATNPGVVSRHRSYVEALERTGVEVIMGRFKWKPRWCRACRQEQPGHEEKETDVSIAVRLIEMAVSSECETMVVVTGDTDILPAIHAARRLAPHKQVWVAMPFKRFNHELRVAADGHIKIKATAYAAHQLPEQLTLADGRQISRPATW